MEIDSVEVHELELKNFHNLTFKFDDGSFADYKFRYTKESLRPYILFSGSCQCIHCLSLEKLGFIRGGEPSGKSYDVLYLPEKWEDLIVAHMVAITLKRATQRR